MIKPITVTFAIVFVLVAIATSCVSLGFNQGLDLGFGLYGWLAFVALKASMLTTIFVWRFGWLHRPRTQL